MHLVAGESPPGQWLLALSRTAFLLTAMLYAWNGRGAQMEYDFEVQGDLKITYYRSGSIDGRLRNYEFIISTASGKWYMETVDDEDKLSVAELQRLADMQRRLPPGRGPRVAPDLLSNQLANPYRHLYAGSEGADTYAFSLTSSNSQFSAKYPETNPQASITPGRVPAFGYHLWLLWMTFASSEHLTGHETLLRPPFTVGQAGFRDGMPVYLERLVGRPNLPKRIVFFNRPEAAFRNLPEGFKALDDPDVAVEYHVLSTTNFNECEIPTSFELVRFTSEPQADGPWVRAIHARFVGTVSRVSRSQRPSYLPDLPKPAQVYDYRFRDPIRHTEMLSYTNRPHEWTPTNDATLTKLAKEKRDVADNYSGARTFEHRWLIGTPPKGYGMVQYREFQDAEGKSLAKSEQSRTARQPTYTRFEFGGSHFTVRAPFWVIAASAALLLGLAVWLALVLRRSHRET